MVRRALVMAAGEQYVRIAAQFGLILAVSRLLTPTEIGVSVIGTGIMTFALGAREFATSDFLIQRASIGVHDLRASFTVVVLLTTLIAALLFVLAPSLGSFYGEDELARFLRIAAIGGLIEAMSFPVRGLLRRELAFGRLAIINTAAVVGMATTTLLLAFIGFSFMSFAWGMVAAGAVTTVLSFAFRPVFHACRPTFRSWSNVLRFGGYNGASFLINRGYVALPQLVLGLVLPHAAVGIFNRATVVSDIPDKLVLTSAVSVAFPALAASIREGRSLKEPYLRTLALMTALYWPGLVLLIVLAQPVVLLLLGSQWLDAVPLVQVMAIAGCAWFPVILTSPVLLALAANRDRLFADLIGRSGSAVIMCAAAPFGIMAMAASKLVTLPFQMIVSFCFVRRHVAFRWRDLGAALWRSAAVTAASATGPVSVLALAGSGFDLSSVATALVLVLAGAGWLLGVILVQHPVLEELQRLGGSFATTPLARTVIALCELLIARRPRTD